MICRGLRPCLKRCAMDRADSVNAVCPFFIKRDILFGMIIHYFLTFVSILVIIYLTEDELRE